MAKELGRQIQFGIAKESTRGTAAASATFWVPTSDASLDEKKELIFNEQSIGVLEDTAAADIGKQFVEGSFKAPIGSKHFGMLLYAMLGGLNTAANADGSGTIKDHTFTVAQSIQPQALTLFMDDPGAQDYKYALGSLTQLEITYERGEYVTYSATFKAKKGATATNTPAITSEERFTHKHVTFKVASNLAGLGAASPIAIKSLSLTFKRNTEDDDVLGAVEPVDFLSKQFTCEGKLEAMWQNESDFKTAFMANTAQALRIDLVNTDVVIGTSANARLKIDLAKVYWTELTKPIQINGLVMQSLSFKATYSSTDTSMVSAVLTNAQASY